MNDICMNESEICMSYQQAKNRKKQIRILAELNATTTAIIVDTLKCNGCIQETDNKWKPRIRMPHALMQERLVALAAQGLTASQAAEEIGCTCEWIRRAAAQHRVQFQPACRKKAQPEKPERKQKGCAAAIDR